jgi:hypothetical protein
MLSTKVLRLPPGLQMERKFNIFLCVPGLWLGTCADDSASWLHVWILARCILVVPPLRHNHG